MVVKTKGKKVGKRRTLRDIESYVSPRRVLALVETDRTWEYKLTPAHYVRRDRALLSLLYLTGGRINEVLKIQRDQIDLESDRDFVLIHNFRISKRKERTLKQIGVPRIQIPLPREGRFGPFTEKVLAYLPYAPRTGRIFRIGRVRAWQIVNHMTGIWCHWFRAQKLSWLVNQFRSALIVSKMVGIKEPNTISHYYQTEWQVHRKELLK